MPRKSDEGRNPTPAENLYSPMEERGHRREHHIGVHPIGDSPV